MIHKINESLAFLKAKGIDDNAIGIVLGTGLGDLVDHLKIEIEIPYSEIPHFPQSTMEFQKARLLYGSICLLYTSPSPRDS